MLECCFGALEESSSNPEPQALHLEPCTLHLQQPSAKGARRRLRPSVVARNGGPGRVGSAAEEIGFRALEISGIFRV